MFLSNPGTFPPQPLWLSSLKVDWHSLCFLSATAMTNIEYVAHENRGINYISLTPPAQRTGARLGRVDRILIAIVLSSYVGLVFFLVR